MIGRNAHIETSRGQTPAGQRRVVVGMQQIVSDPGMVRLDGQQPFQDRRGPELIRMGRVRRLTGQRVSLQGHGDAPGRDRATRIAPLDVRELGNRILAPEGMQPGHRVIEFGLHGGTA